MDPDTRALSAQLYCMLIMVCQEGTQKLLEHAGDTEGGVAGRQCALLQALLHHGVPGNPACSALSGEDVSEALKVTLVQRHHDALKTHHVLHASRLSNFQLVREEVHSVLTSSWPRTSECQWTSALSM